jgi:hypothetical protein
MKDNGRFGNEPSDINGARTQRYEHKYHIISLRTSVIHNYVNY